MTNSSRTQKADILDSMMKHPETRRLIKEALSSPLGSTSRTKLQKHMSIMSKLHNTNYGTDDGAGGPGVIPEQYPGNQPEFDAVHNPSEGSKGMVIFHKIPKPRITYGKVAPTMDAARKDQARAGSFNEPVDGSGGPGMQYQRMGQAEAATYDGAGGFFGDLYDSAKSGISNLFSSTPTSTPSTAMSTPAMPSSYTPMFSTPYSLPQSSSYNSQNIPLMAQGSYNNTPIAPVATALKSNLSPTYTAPATSSSTYANAPFKPTVAPLTQATSSNQTAATSSTPNSPIVSSFSAQSLPGLDPKRPVTTSWDKEISDYNDRSTAENAIRAISDGAQKVSSFVGSVPYGAEALGEYALKNAWTGVSNFFKKKSNQEKYTDIGDTFGARVISDINSRSNDVSDSLRGAPFDPNATKTLGKTPITVTKTDPVTGKKEEVVVKDQVKTDSGTPAVDPKVTKTIENTDLSWYAAPTKPGEPTYNDLIKSNISKIGGTGSVKTTEDASKALSILGNYGDKNSEIAAGIMAAATKYNIDPALLVAQIGHELGASYSPVASANNNVAGITATSTNGLSQGTARPSNEGGNYARFNSVAESIDYQAGLISSRTGGPSSNITGGNNTYSTLGSSSFSGTVDPATGLYTPNNNQPGAIRVDALGNPIKADVQPYIDSSMGAGAATNAIYNSLGMKGEAVDAVEIDKAAREKSGIDADRANYQKLINEGTTLPDDMAAFIKSRDEDLVNTDRTIKDYNLALSQTSDPTEKANIRMRLNTMYANRSMLNTNYMGIINDAVKDHQRKIDAAKSKFDTDLEAYTTETTRGQAISKERYATIKATVTDMYTDMQNAPLRAMQLREYQTKLYTAANGSAVDASKLTYLYQDNEMKNQFTDSAGRLSTGGKSLTDWADLMVTGSGMTVPNFTAKWDVAIGKYMAEKETDKGEFSNKEKMSVAKDQMAQYANLAVQSSLDTNNVNPYSKQLMNMGIDGAKNMARTFSEKQVLELNGKGPMITEAIKGLASKGWMPGSSMKPIPESEFITNFNAKVGGDYTDMAKAIYYRFSQVATSPENTQKALDSILYNISSTQDANGATRLSKGNLKTPEEMVKTAADIYAGYLLESTMFKDPGSGVAQAYNASIK